MHGNIPAMRRHWWYRVLGILVALWFGALTAEPVALHPCPMHDGMLLAMAGMHGGGGHADMPGMGGDAQAAPHGPSRPDVPQQPGSHQCTCLGSCTASSSLALVPAPIALADADVRATDDASPPADRHVPVTASHVLPFATAPPRSSPVR
ncbi:MAG TPA: hypothetical protein VFW98_12920 [Gemmatimonadaceae bacterium]|nr:hypothetical protein [Gemmatimonadaceae bacterium]